MLMLALSFFFFNDTATTEIYTLSLHDALPIFFALASRYVSRGRFHLASIVASTEVWSWTTFVTAFGLEYGEATTAGTRGDRKSTRLNSSHDQISYAVFCLKKKTEHSADSLPCF